MSIATSASVAQMLRTLKTKLESTFLKRSEADALRAMPVVNQTARSVKIKPNVLNKWATAGSLTSHSTQQCREW